MADSKSASRMDSWRNYFRSSNADIFETIERAIMVAACDYPTEFRIRRDGIAQTLFNCKLIKCCGCDKLELALPDDDDGVLKCSNRNESKGSNKEISSSRDDNDNDNDNNNNNRISDYSYEVAEALTDEIEEETQIFGEVMRIKAIINNSKDESESVLYGSLRKLQLMALSVETLKATEIGKSVNSLRKHASSNVSQIARTLIDVWKEMVDQWVIATEKMAVSEATPESLNPSGLDDDDDDEEEEEEEGLPSPPLDDLAFFYPHDTSLELSEFFDGMDEYAKEKQSRPKWKQQKLSNGPNMVPMKQDGSTKMTKKPSSVVKPITQIKSNTKRKVQTLPKRPVAPNQTKPKAAGEATGQDKFEAAKRKLHERYQQAENAKKQRTIQVMELHDLPKQQQHFRPGNNHNRHRSSYPVKK